MNDLESSQQGLLNGSSLEDSPTFTQNPSIGLSTSTPPTQTSQEGQQLPPPRPAVQPGETLLKGSVVASSPNDALSEVSATPDTPLVQLEAYSSTAAPSMAPTTPAKPARPLPAAVVPPAVAAGHGGLVWRTEDDSAAAVARERDVAAAFAGLPRVRHRWTHNHMKILIVGEDCLGKTTFVRNLFAAYASNVNFPISDASGEGARRAFAEKPELLQTKLVVKDDEAQVVWHYVIQDTPGFGDFDGPADAEAQRCEIISHIQACSQRYLDMELDAGRNASMHNIPDPRIDVCLFFLPPHRLRPADSRFMKELESVVPVVPILTKADAMTPDELSHHRHAVKTALRPGHSARGWRFSKEALEAAGAHHGPPFAVVCATTVDRSVGRFWPVRRYKWGRCEALLTEHSELPALRRLLLEAGYWEIKEHTEQEYLKFRRTVCKERENPVPRPIRALVRLAGGAALAAVAIVLAVNTAPLVHDTAVRRETVRRVKTKIGEAVGGAVGAVQDAQGKAGEVAHAAKGVAGAAVESGKRTAARATATLETPAVKAARVEVGRKRAEKAASWWAWWRKG